RAPGRPPCKGSGEPRPPFREIATRPGNLARPCPSMAQLPMAKAVGCLVVERKIPDPARAYPSITRPERSAYTTSWSHGAAARVALDTTLAEGHLIRDKATISRVCAEMGNIGSIHHCTARLLFECP
ncbi:MAG: hypothetical protein Q6365_023655, partial [Candidatus Sigynarchaeota archaeon]